MAQTATKKIISAPIERDTRNQSVLEIALGKDYDAYRQLMIDAKTKQLPFEDAEKKKLSKRGHSKLEELRSYCQTIVDFVEANYVHPEVHDEFGQGPWVGGMRAWRMMNMGGKGNPDVEVLCYLHLNEGLTGEESTPFLPVEGWAKFVNHMGMIRELYGEDYFRVQF